MTAAAHQRRTRGRRPAQSFAIVALVGIAASGLGSAANAGASTGAASSHLPHRPQTRQLRGAFSGSSVDNAIGLFARDGVATAADESAAQRFGVGIHRETLVDPSRPTPPNGTAPGQPDRRFPVAVWYPARGTAGRAVRADAVPDRRHGPYPLVVFVHGFTETPYVYADLLARVAASGYVVAAPALPLSNGDAPGGPSQADVASHPADVRFVLTQLLAQTTQPDDALHGLIAADRVAVAGHSMGGAIAYSLGFESCCRDPRVLAVLDFSQLPIALRPADDPPQPFETGTGTPVLFINGDHDEYFPPAVFTAADASATAPKYEVTLVGATHKPPYQRRSDPHFAVVVATTIDVLDATIARRPDRGLLVSRLRRDIKSARNIATLAFATP